MSKIDVSQWGEFKLSDMFDVCYGKFIPKKLRGIKTPFITTTSLNNGIAYYVDSDPMFDGDALTVASDGSVGETFYHDKPFSAGNIAVVMEPKDIVRNAWSPNSALFLSTVIRRYAEIKFGWENKFSVNRVRDAVVKLPITLDGKPDWEYMDNYIVVLAARAHKGVSSLNHVKSKSHKININNWKKFKVGDLFDVQLTNGDNKPDKLPHGDIPLVATIDSNNGIVGRYDSDTTIFPKGSITVDMFGHVFVQRENFQTVAHGHVNVVLNSLSFNESLYIAAIINRVSLSKGFGFSTMLTKTRLQKLVIQLPVDDDGQPNWQYMDSYIANCAALCHRDVTALRSVTGM